MRSPYSLQLVILALSFSFALALPKPADWKGKDKHVNATSESNQTEVAPGVIIDKKADWNLMAISNKEPLDFDHGGKPFTYRNSTRTTFIYVLDSGINIDHEEFGGRAFKGYDDGSPVGPRRHGTFVAGVAGGATCGVARNATLIDVRVSNEGVKGYEMPSEGLRWAISDIANANRTGRAVILFAAGALDHDDKHFTAQLERAEELDIPVVVAAGNKPKIPFADAPNVKDFYPANQDNTIAVGATNSDYRRLSESAWGIGIDIWAPGHHIQGPGGKDHTSYFQQSGTSAAAPHVAGVIAHLLDVEGPLTVAQIRSRLLDELAQKDILKELKGSPNRFLFNGVPDGISKSGY